VNHVPEPPLYPGRSTRWICDSTIEKTFFTAFSSSPDFFYTQKKQGPQECRDAFFRPP
jgi:hypothetical protein